MLNQSLLTTEGILTAQTSGFAVTLKLIISEAPAWSQALTQTQLWLLRLNTIIIKYPPRFILKMLQFHYLSTGVCCLFSLQTADRAWTCSIRHSRCYFVFIHTADILRCNCNLDTKKTEINRDTLHNCRAWRRHDLRSDGGKVFKAVWCQLSRGVSSVIIQLLKVSHKILLRLVSICLSVCGILGSYSSWIYYVSCLCFSLLTTFIILKMKTTDYKHCRKKIAILKMSAHKILWKRLKFRKCHWNVGRCRSKSGP